MPVFIACNFMVGNKKLFIFSSLGLEVCILYHLTRKTQILYSRLLQTYNYHIQIIGFFVKKDLVF